MVLVPFRVVTICTHSLLSLPKYLMSPYSTSPIKNRSQTHASLVYSMVNSCHLPSLATYASCLLIVVEAKSRMIPGLGLKPCDGKKHVVKAPFPISPAVRSTDLSRQSVCPRSHHNAPHTQFRLAADGNVPCRK